MVYVKGMKNTVCNGFRNDNQSLPEICFENLKKHLGPRWEAFFNNTHTHTIANVNSIPTKKQ